MSRSTGPILAAGAIALANVVVVQGKPFDQQVWRIPVGTAIAAGGLALLEHLSETLAVGLAWLALVTMLFTRITPGVLSPIESFNSWYEGGKK
jgi:hypothetical protein